MSVDLSRFCLAQWYGKGEGHQCNYCKKDSSKTGSISYGMHTEDLSVDAYKNLIDRGWRRSGKYCYKPIMDEVCCPQYPIRCDAVNFTMNKSHKRIIKKFNKFMNDGVLSKNDIQNSEGVDNNISCMPEFEKPSAINLDISLTSEKEINIDEGTFMDSGNESVIFEQPKCQEESNLDTDIKNSSTDSQDVQILNKKQFNQGVGADPNKPPCKKAKLLRLERKSKKLIKKGEDISTRSNRPNNEQKSLNQFLEEIPTTSKHKLKLKLIPSNELGPEPNKTTTIEFQLFEKYQAIVHGDPPDLNTMRRFIRFLITSPLKIVIEKMDKNHRTFNMSAKLYKKYQMTVHNEPPSECGPDEFYYFLVSTPLKPKPFPKGIEGPGYGSFHQQYWLDDKLIAVGVIDILPECLSSVYFFYDPDYRGLTLGTYGSLREVQLVQQFQCKIPDLRYYYMGFYIHACPKMRYKGRLHPSYLLCPETYVWCPIENCLPKLDINKYSRLNDDSEDKDRDNCSPNDVDNIKVVSNRRLMQVKDYLRLTRAERSDFEVLGAKVGKKCIHNFVFWLN